MTNSYVRLLVIDDAPRHMELTLADFAPALAKGSASAGSAPLGAVKPMQFDDFTLTGRQMAVTCDLLSVLLEPERRGRFDPTGWSPGGTKGDRRT